MATSTLQRPRRRLKPEDRRALILDHTADLIARDGLSAASIEQIGKEAGISKSLVYAYFPNLTELLRALYQREMRRLRRLQAEAAQGAQSMQEVVRSITHTYLSYIDERGLIIERLQAEPSVSQHHDPTDFNRNAAVDYMAEIVMKYYKLTPEIARAATDISFGLPASAGSYLSRGELDLKTIEDMTVTMIMGTLAGLEQQFGE